MSRKTRLPKPKLCFEVPIYGGVVFFYTNRKAYDTAIAQVQGDPIGDDCAGYFVAAANGSGDVAYLVGVFDKYPSTVIHEIGHAALAILKRAGMDPFDSGGEAFCYLQGALLQHLGIDK